ncbi:TetR/AcrR family transcriptional regulator C-terminal domain-containing protein [Sagittula stellata]|uniref:Transcriptional regulator, TetR family protein n=1 Tax=Sagittula stellata (strain ATCC 700073 / DSM 11524 / E-37) TaxID=388399 RepID=A3K0J2_SAGS3|nr:TetR/AcrR family transcriptional regulator C-terminal domain-containing protein [Sagittula stellata]EBA09307.1 transcriptional regulator, TetR family protein [Sagittula stellata E-37]
MKAENREAREAQIAAAAYALLAEKGAQGMSMLAVAKRAKASNETLYRWYGDKTGLFAMLIARNADRVLTRLDGLTAGDDGLQRLGEALLEMLLSPEALALNRAAASDVSGQLGSVLAEAGRGAVFPRVAGAFARLVADGRLSGPAEEVATLWIDLLVGDLQVRCVTGALAPPDADTRAARAARAEALIFRLAA